jgi:hypothetical protein
MLKKITTKVLTKLPKPRSEAVRDLQDASQRPFARLCHECEQVITEYVPSGFWMGLPFNMDLERSDQCDLCALILHQLPDRVEDTICAVQCGTKNRYLAFISYGNNYSAFGDTGWVHMGFFLDSVSRENLT